MEDVVITAGARTLNIDVGASAIASPITLDGSALRESLRDNRIEIGLRDRSTGVTNVIDVIEFGYWTGTDFPVDLTSAPLYDGVVGATVLPGVYDVIYARGRDTDQWSWGTSPGDPYPTGVGVIMEDVVIGAGANRLDVDIASAALSGSITLDGGALPSSLRDDRIEIGLRNRSTGDTNVIDVIEFGYWTGTDFPVDLTSQPLYDGVVGATILPGRYDVVYARDYDADGYFWGTAPGDAYPTGYGVIAACVDY